MLPNIHQIQEDAIKLTLQGYHVVQNIATGGGKSFAQIATNLFAEGVTIEEMFIIVSMTMTLAIMMMLMMMTMMPMTMASEHLHCVYM